MIQYLKGDATKPQHSGKCVIAHVCNDVGKWGAGFTAALDKLSDIPREVFLFKGQRTLGFTSFALVAEDLIVANMCAQHGVGRRNIPIRYAALEKCLKTVAGVTKSWKATLHMPRIGCGLAGGRWQEVEPILQRTCLDVEVFVYDL